MPEVIGMSIKMHKIIYSIHVYIGSKDYLYDVDPSDLALAALHCKEKPPSLSPEFTNLVNIIMDEEQLTKPITVKEGVILYVKLLNFIDN